MEKTKTNQEPLLGIEETKKEIPTEPVKPLQAQIITPNKPAEPKQPEQKQPEQKQPETAAPLQEQIKQQVQKKAPAVLKGKKSNEISALLEMYKPQIAQLLPKTLTAERMIQIATTVIAQNPALLECTASSLIGSVLQASMLGFPPIPALGYCFFIPFKNNIGTKGNPNYVKEVQFQIGYKGYINLASRSANIKSIFPDVVREGDEFYYELGLEPKLKHIPGEKRGQITHAYTVVHYVNGGFSFNVITREDIENLRKRNIMQRDGIRGAWATDYESMARAKAIKQITKYIPLSLDVQSKIATDGAVINISDFSKSSDGKPELKLEKIEYTTTEEEEKADE